jgi:3-oxoadipate enol-lactonase
MPLNHSIAGSTGPPVVLLHGLGSCGDDWIFQVEALQNRYRTLTIDLPGHGDSEIPAGWPTIADIAGEVSRLMDELGEGPAHFVGLSLGGAVALQIAVDSPSRVRSLTIVNASATLSGGWRRIPVSLVRIGLLAVGQMKWLGMWVAKGLFPRDDQVELRRVAAMRIGSNTRRSYAKSAYAVVRFDLRSQVHTIQVPTLVVAAERDTTVPLRAKRWLAQTIPNAKLQVIPNSRHATPLDAHKAFNQRLLKFLGELDLGSVLKEEARL